MCIEWSTLQLQRLMSVRLLKEHEPVRKNTLEFCVIVIFWELNKLNNKIWKRSRETDRKFRYIEKSIRGKALRKDTDLMFCRENFEPHSKGKSYGEDGRETYQMTSYWWLVSNKSHYWWRKKAILSAIIDKTSSPSSSTTYAKSLRMRLELQHFYEVPHEATHNCNESDLYTFTTLSHVTVTRLHVLSHVLVGMFLSRYKSLFFLIYNCSYIDVVCKN